VFVLSGQAVRLPGGNSACLVLIRELTSLLFSLASDADSGFAQQRSEVYTCGGCTGLIKFQITELPEDQQEEEEKEGSEYTGIPKKIAHVREKKSAGTFSGTLADISPSELLQFFHMHQKTGKLLLHVPDGIGRVAFREGGIIGAKFGELEGRDAIFALLAESEGRFTFQFGIPPSLQVVDEIGDFMMIIMEGIKRLDEG
jgi:hypothetical protein